MRRKTKKIMALNRCLHPKSSVERMYMNWKEGGRGLTSVEECITKERRGLYYYLKDSKEDMLSEGKAEEEFAKRKRDERLFYMEESYTKTSCRENKEHCTWVFRKVNKEWTFEEKDRYVICSSGVGTKNQSNPIKYRQTTSFSKIRVASQNKNSNSRVFQGFPGHFSQFSRIYTMEIQGFSRAV